MSVEDELCWSESYHIQLDAITILLHCIDFLDVTLEGTQLSAIPKEVA